MTLKRILTNDNPGKLMKKEMLAYNGLFKNLEKSDKKYVDPITFIYSLYKSNQEVKILKDLSHFTPEETYSVDFRYNFLTYVKNRDSSDTKLLWKLALAFYTGKKWKKLFKKASKEVYSIDIESLSALAHFMNPYKFRFISKIERLSNGFSYKKYLESH